MIDYSGTSHCVDYQFSSVRFISVAQSCPTLCDPMNRSTPGLPVYHQLLEFTQTHVHRVSDAIQPSHPQLSPSPPAPNPSQHQNLFQWVNSLMRLPKYWSFSFSIIPSKEIPGLISFRMDWLDLLTGKLDTYNSIQLESLGLKTYLISFRFCSVLPRRWYFFFHIYFWS